MVLIFSALIQFSSNSDDKFSMHPDIEQARQMSKIRFEDIVKIINTRTFLAKTWTAKNVYSGLNVKRIQSSSNLKKSR